MGIFEFKLPDIGEGVVEGEVVEWMVSVGDTVKEDDPILSVMTDKATVEIPSPTDGVVKSIVGEPGTILAVGQVCIDFETDGEGTPAPVEKKVEATPEPAPEKTPEPEPAPASKPAPAAKSTPVVVAAPGARPLASPAVRQRARESGIDLSGLSGS
jgi:2-oxoisovalerate dehydrogenase E2 component (dihydrolipoyl transacylase)